MNVSIIVHGGAGKFGASLNESTLSMDGCLAAARAGYGVLRAGGSALDAAVAAVVLLEDDALFNAGTGSVLNADGVVEMDAAVMDGDGGRAGAVATVRTVRNPILLARLVMERTSHVLLAGPGADAFAREQGVPAVSPESLVTVAARRAWERAVAAQGATAAIAPDVTATRNSKANTNAETDTDTENAPVGHGTVGAVAFDGVHVAAATSTGGTSMKRPGRVGDSPLIGCGTYAWDGAGAVSCTGLGEAIIRAVLGKSAVDLLARGLDPTTAAEQVLPRLRPLGGDGGLILVDARGRLGLAFSTERMAHAWVDVDGNEVVGFRATDDSG